MSDAKIILDTNIVSYLMRGGLLAEAYASHVQLTRAVRVARDMLYGSGWCLSCFRSPVIGSAWKYWLEQW